VAPEIIRRKQGKKARTSCDVFSAGVIFYSLLTNRLLFEGSTNKEIYQANLECDIDIDDERFKHIEKKALNLLFQMLDEMFNQRISAQDSL
jgi:serine/threonine protein kinase